MESSGRFLLNCTRCGVCLKGQRRNGETVSSLFHRHFKEECSVPAATPVKSQVSRKGDQGILIVDEAVIHTTGNGDEPRVA